MELLTLKNSIKNGEGKNLEFKRKVDFPEKVAKEVVAFSNSSGGKLYIGIDDDGVVRGLKDPEGDLFLLKSFIDTRVRPKLVYTSEVIKINEKKGIVCFDIPEGNKKPYSILFDEPPLKRSYVRVEDQSIKASREMKMILQRQKNNRGVNIIYDDYISNLLAYLQTHNKITVKETQQILRVPRKKASGILVKLTLARILKLIPHGANDVYVQEEIRGKQI